MLNAGRSSRFTALEAKLAGYSDEELMNPGYSEKELERAERLGVELKELKHASYSKEEIKHANDVLMKAAYIEDSEFSSVSASLV